MTNFVLVNNVYLQMCRTTWYVFLYKQLLDEMKDSFFMSAFSVADSESKRLQELGLGCLVRSEAPSCV